MAFGIPDDPSVPQTIIVPNISLKTAGQQNLFITNPNVTQRFFPTAIFFELTAVSGISLLPTISIGSNSGFNNWVGSTLLTGVSSLNQVFKGTLLTISTVDPGTTFGVNVIIPATGTTYTVKFIIQGLYV